MKAHEITIVITLYNRQNYVGQAIQSALNQTIPVRVIVVEDCGPNPEIQKQVIARFGDRIEYVRNQRRHGLFDTWNVCLDLCQSPWISILHDDDYLSENYVERMIAFSDQFPDRGIYFCSVPFVDDDGNVVSLLEDEISDSYDIDLQKFAIRNLVLFPGQLMRVEAVKAMGGFRKLSMFTGDWDMWYKLAFHFGAAKTTVVCAFCRTHEGIERGTNKVMREGRKFALDFVQIKRNLALLKTRNTRTVFNRKKILEQSPIPIRYILQTAVHMPPRILAYHTSLLSLSSSPSILHAVFKNFTKLLGRRFIYWCSKFSRKSF